MILIFILFFNEIPLSKQNSSRRDVEFYVITSGATICLCPIHRTQPIGFEVLAGLVFH